MLPTRSERILQDMNDVQNTPVRGKLGTRTLVGIVAILCILGLLYLRSLPRVQTQQLSSLLPTVDLGTPKPPTNTFVDATFGTVVFFKENSFVSLSLPDRAEKPIVGIDNNAEVNLQSTIPPVWSPDGILIGVAVEKNSFVVSEYDSGRYKGTFPLPENVSEDSLVISIDPASEVIAIGEKASESTVRFYSLQTQKEIGVYPRCSGDGVWITGVGYATICTVGESQNIMLIRFEPNSSVMTPLAPATKTVQYQIVDEYRPGSLLVERTQFGRKELVTVSATGSIAVIPAKEYKSVQDIDQIVNATSALKKRIETVAKTKPVKDVSVSPDNSFLVFETDEGLFVAKLDLKDPPFLLGPGSKPRIRPF